LPQSRIERRVSRQSSGAQNRRSVRHRAGIHAFAHRPLQLSQPYASSSNHAGSSATRSDACSAPDSSADVGIAAPPTRRPKPPPPSTLAMSVIDEPLLSRTAQRLAATTTALAHSAPPVRLLSDFRAFPNTLPNAPERKPLTTKGFRWRRGNLLLPRGDPLGTTLRHNRLAKNGPGCPGVRSSRSLCRN